MSKGVIAEDTLKQYLRDLSPASGFVVGLILSQRCSQRDYVVHLPSFQTSQPVPPFTSLQEVNVKNLVVFAKQLNAFLPGGLNVSGIFSASSDDTGVLDQSQSAKLQSLLTCLFSKLDPLLLTSSALPDKLAMHYNASSDKVTCKCVNITDTKWYLSNMDWKFQTIPWQGVETKFGFDLTDFIHAEDNRVTTLKSSLAKLLQVKCNEIKHTHCLLNGEIHDLNTPLEEISCSSQVNAQLLIPCTEEPSIDVEYVKCCGDLVMTGHVYSRIYVHPKSSVGDIISALKEDVVRSLRTRFELHTDALIEEEEGSPEEKVVQHDLPRRILFPVPYSKLMLSNYLFPGEAAKDSLTSVKQLLGFDVDVDLIEDNLENEADPELLPSEEMVCCPNIQTEPEQSFMTLYTVLAVGVLFLALCTTLLLMDGEEQQI